MPHRSPARSEAKEYNETLRVLKSENRRLRKLLKEARKLPQEAEDNEDEYDTDPQQPASTPHVSCPLLCTCSRKDQTNIKTVDFVSHVLWFCKECNCRKSVKKSITCDTH